MRDMFSPSSDSILQRGSDENLELLKAWAGTSLAFAIFSSGGQVFAFTFLSSLLIAAVTCGIGFLLHELAHRAVARNYGAEAHFVANDGWLLISILIAFVGLFIAAPGAVWHSGYLTKRQSGLIALAGPATNMVLAVAFLAIGLAAGFSGLPDFWLRVGWVGYYINAWLGLFNMIPAGPFDGAKVIAWSPVVFGVTAVVGVVLVFVVPQII